MEGFLSWKKTLFVFAESSLRIKRINHLLICTTRKLAATPRQMLTLREKYYDFDQISSKVFKCRRDDQFFTMKIVSILNEENQANNGVPYRIIREISILKELDHINIVRLIDVMTDGPDLFLVFEYLDNEFQADFLKNPKMFMYPQMKKEFLYQILNTVAYLHARKILLRDLRPENILVNVRTQVLKIALFGAARTFEAPLEAYSSSVGCLSYRSPEVLFQSGCEKYSTPNDVWAVGCIFGEMLLHRPLFSGPSDVELLDEIFTLLGTPTEETWPGVTSICGTCALMGPPQQPKDLAKEFPMLNPDGLDLLSKMLCLCPNYRISAEDAVKHPYFKGV
ncbi:Cell division control protein 2 [Glycine soja]